MSQSEDAARVAMTDVLSAVASELALAQTKCARLDGALGQLLEAMPAHRRGAVMREFHVVDLLNQQIAAVATFLEHLTDGAPGAELIDVRQALGAVTLGEVADRLRQNVGQPPLAAVAVSEEVDFF